MKKIFYTSILTLLVLCSSCERLVGVDLDTAPPQLVVDAAIKWQKGTPGNEQKIKLTTTTGYFNTKIPVVSGAIVSVKNSANTVFDFLEVDHTGQYVCNTFVPVIGENYTLSINYLGQTLTASETLKGVPSISRITQEIMPGFGQSDDQINIKTYFTDPGNTIDFYLTQIKASNNNIPEYSVRTDEFFQGNEIFDRYFNDELKPGNVVRIELDGISERYYNYMNILTSISGNAGGGPFATPPSLLRGNIINTTFPKNIALGYFSLSEVDLKIYTVQ